MPNSFQLIYDHGQPTAVIVDLASFEQIEVVMDNLLNRGLEAEDQLIAQSEALRQSGGQSAGNG